MKLHESRIQKRDFRVYFLHLKRKILFGYNFSSGDRGDSPLGSPFLSQNVAKKKKFSLIRVS